MVGKYRHTVDPKGRLFVPAKLREELGDSFYVTLGLEHCLSVYTEAGWQAIVDKYNALPMSQARKMRFLFANAAKCEPDKQGRFPHSHGAPGLCRAQGRGHLPGAGGPRRDLGRRDL